jgi:hypothetical protein
VDVRVDEPGHGEHALRLDHLQAVGAAAHDAVADHQVADLVDAGGGVEHPRSAHHEARPGAGALGELRGH